MRGINSSERGGSMKCCLMVLLLGLTACDDSCWGINAKNPNQEKRTEIFLKCLAATRSSVVNANDDEDTDDTIQACENAAYYQSLETKPECKKEITNDR